MCASCIFFKFCQCVIAIVKAFESFAQLFANLYQTGFTVGIVLAHERIDVGDTFLKIFKVSRIGIEIGIERRKGVGNIGELDYGIVQTSRYIVLFVQNVVEFGTSVLHTGEQRKNVSASFGHCRYGFIEIAFYFSHICHDVTLMLKLLKFSLF